MKTIQYHKLPTEKENPSSRSLDSFSVERIVRLMNREDAKIARSVGQEIKPIVRAVHLAVSSLKSGGRFFFVGAGTSGRLGVLESAELPPTFGTPPALAQAVMAGGNGSVFRSREGAEDDVLHVQFTIRKKVKKNDIVIGVAASGVTPFVLSAIKEARRIGAKTVLVTCNNAVLAKGLADVVIAPRVGPEILQGSTRLKSGTATKMVLNMISTSTMVRLGKVYGNRMVDLQPKSVKLRERGVRLVQDLSGISPDRARQFLLKSRWKVKIAILMAKKNLNYSKAQKTLKMHGGFLSRCLE